MLRFKERGDTLIEVLFAVTVFSLVIVGALVIMNQGTAAAQRSLEISLVRQQIDAQAETLRFMHDSYVSVYQPNMSEPSVAPAKQWYLMRADILTADQKTTSDMVDGNGRCSSTHPAGSFVIDPRSVRYVNAAANIVPSVTYSQLTYLSNGNFKASEGLWVEPLHSNEGYIDFHIRACWDSIGSDIPMTLSTIVRLYEPNR